MLIKNHTQIIQLVFYLEIVYSIKNCIRLRCRLVDIDGVPTGVFDFLLLTFGLFCPQLLIILALSQISAVDSLCLRKRNVGNLNDENIVYKLHISVKATHILLFELKRFNLMI